MKRIILVGGNGNIGRTIVEDLHKKYQFIVYDKRVDNVKHLCECHIIDASDYSALSSLKAVEVDCIVDLTSVPTGEGILHPTEYDESFYNVFLKCVYNVLYYAIENNIGKIVYCSSNHVTGLLEKNGFSCKQNGEKISIYDSFCPEGLYGALKTAGELIVNAFSCKYQIEAYNLRIGSYRYCECEKNNDERFSRTWIDRALLIKCFDAVFHHNKRGCHTYYLCSDNQNCPWDTSNLYVELFD